MKKIVVLFGGKSYEREVSINSTKSILENMDRNKYDIKLVYIDEKGDFYRVSNIEKLPGKRLKDFNILKNCDLVFPIMHGNNYEDGVIQGFLETLNVKYVGCNLISSALCMDKVFTKKMLDSIGILNAKYVYFYKENYNFSLIKKRVKKEIGYPCFVKPANSGSSIGISKVYSEKDLEEKILNAFSYDDKILIEEFIKGREVEIGILGKKDNLILSEIGEVKEINSDFYDYDAKYNNKDLVLEIPALIDDSLKKNIEKCAKDAFLALECSIISRVDFLIRDKKVYLNEINTFPGFTSSSMYPKLFEKVGISYKDLIDKIIELSL